MPIPKKTRNFYKRQLNIFQWPPKMTISEWAVKNRIVSGEETSAPGPWYADRAPYTVGIMDAISDPTVE